MVLVLEQGHLLPRGLLPILPAPLGHHTLLVPQDHILLLHHILLLLWDHTPLALRQGHIHPQHGKHQGATM